jgi:hypothetical protein
LAPPNGIPIRAHFQVIHIDSARTSSSTTSGWYRIPPFDGPRAMLWVTRYPSKTSMWPSSIVTGMATVTAFLHFERTLTMFSSIGERARDVPELRLRDLVGVLAKVRDRFLNRHVHTPLVECPYAVAESMTAA